MRKVLPLLVAVACAKFDIGERPFLCSGGRPECPDGYACDDDGVCVAEEGESEAESESESESESEGTPPDCGDSICGVDEDCSNCPSDCFGPGCCGNGVCDDATETCSACPEDCGECCGDGVCDDAIETCDGCPDDCGSCCGDGTCDASAGESLTTCPADCSCVTAPETCTTMGPTYCCCATTGMCCDWNDFGGACFSCVASCTTSCPKLCGV